MSKKSVLIVEDEVITALTIEEKLKSFGYKIKGIFGSGEEAVAAVDANGIDIVLMDINLSGPMDGIEASEIIHRKRGIPIVFMTAYSDRYEELKSRLSFTFGLISKPIIDGRMREVLADCYRDGKA